MIFKTAPFHVVCAVATLLIISFGSARPALANNPTAAIKTIRFDHSQELSMAGRDARLQLLVTGLTQDGQEIDLSHQVSFAATPVGIVDFDGSLVVPLAAVSYTHLTLPTILRV